MSPIPGTPREFLEACRRGDRLLTWYERATGRPFPDLEQRALEFEALSAAAATELDEQLVLDHVRNEPWAWIPSETFQQLDEIARRLLGRW
jgi:hypothetical protein